MSHLRIIWQGHPDITNRVEKVTNSALSHNISVKIQELNKLQKSDNPLSIKTGFVFRKKNVLINIIIMNTENNWHASFKNTVLDTNSAWPYL